MDVVIFKRFRCQGRQEMSQNGSDGRKVLPPYVVALVERYTEMAITMYDTMFVMSTPRALVTTVPWHCSACFDIGTWSKNSMAANAAKRLDLRRTAADNFVRCGGGVHVDFLWPAARG